MLGEKKQYRTIKALVFDYVRRAKGKVDYTALTREIRDNFPQSAWKPTHWAWYSHQIRKGRFKSDFSEDIRRNLGAISAGPCGKPEQPVPPRGQAEEVLSTQRGPEARDPGVKKLGDSILEHTRFVIALAAKEDPDLRFRLNRWVFARLMREEIRLKRPIKKALWDSGMRSCRACGQVFASLKGVEIHRKESRAGYSVEGCELLCRECHQEIGRRRGERDTP